MCIQLTRRQLLHATGITLVNTLLLNTKRVSQHGLLQSAYAQSGPEEEPIKVCIDRSGSLHTTDPEARLAALKAKLWPIGSTIRIRFMNGHPAVQEKVAQIALEWVRYANLKFQFTDAYDAEIRIAFNQNDGSWSYVGTEAKNISLHYPTMNFGWLYPNTHIDEYRRVVLHEFGHALGMVHEHQSPAAAIPWNQQAVYDYYAAPPNNWSKAMVDINVFDKYAVRSTQFSEFDSASIMLYAIPAQLTTNGFAVGWNTELSAMDKAYIGQLYPYSPLVKLTERVYLPWADH